MLNGWEWALYEVELTAGIIEYDDSGGDKPPIIFLSGVAIRGDLWRPVIDQLSADFRCIAPTLPLGGHRIPMHQDADLSVTGIANLVDEFLDYLDLSDVTLAMNDWGGAQTLVWQERADRIGRMIITSCEAFENYPPGLPGRSLVNSARMNLLKPTFAILKVPVLRRLPMTWGWMSKRPIESDVMNGWFQGLWTDKLIRRDLRKYVLSTPDKAMMREWTEALRQLQRPTLVIWAKEDKIMPLDHGRRLAEILPQSQLIEVDDSYTLLPRDQPVVLARHIRDFLMSNKSQDATGLVSPSEKYRVPAYGGEISEAPPKTVVRHRSASQI